MYLEEAHAEDEWPIGSSVKIMSHKSISDRLGAVNKLKSETDWYMPTYMDNMANEFNELFKAWPIRFYLIKNLELKYVAMPKDGMFSLPDLETNIENLFQPF